MFIKHHYLLPLQKNTLMLYMYVDNSNVFIEGKRVSAVKKGYAYDIYQAMQKGLFDPDYRIDFGKLHKFVSGNGGTNIAKAKLFGSRPPENDSLWSIASYAGFETIIYDRNLSNKEKKIDISISTEMMRDAYKFADMANDTLILVAGDADFVPTVETLVKDGYNVKVYFWGHAAQELQKNCSEFISLDAHLDKISK
jgi:uncharacterized LabA/DUF88 family protein